ncbi:response regulator [Nocardia stercoris]|uniref:response regulator n=1 Tax=Nocardia stercoris TaxID=2483361 RepID=UPI00131A385C|nr:response regulator transcription factor [Nocardia stercoris]
MRVLLVDDHPRTRAAVTDFLEADTTITVVAEVATLRDAVSAAERLRPDIIVIDPDLPDGDGLSLCRTAAGDPAPPVLILTTDCGPHLVIDAVRAGARGFLVKDPALFGLSDAIRRVAAGESVLDDHSSAVLIHELRRRDARQPV